MAYYLYGIGQAEEMSGLDLTGFPGIEDAGPYRLVIYRNLAGVVGKVRLAEYGEEELKNRFRDAAWLEEKARRHDQAVRWLSEQSTVLPAKFCCIFLNLANIRALLRNRYFELSSSLERVGGKREWAVKVYLDPDQAARLEREHVASTDIETSAGRQFLRRKMASREVAERIRARAREAVGECFKRLSGVSADSRLYDLLPAEATAREGEMMLNAAFLVVRERDDQFRRLVDSLALELSRYGLRVSLSGPWPPYGFTAGSGDGG